MICGRGVRACCCRREGGSEQQGSDGGGVLKKKFFVVLRFISSHSNRCAFKQCVPKQHLTHALQYCQDSIVTS